MEFTMDGLMLESPWSSFPDPELYITEGVDPDLYIQEYATDVTKGNIFKRLWTLLKTIFKAISRKIAEIGNFFSSVFGNKTKKHKDTTLDQIAEDVFGPVKKPGTKCVSFRFKDNREIVMNAAVNKIRADGVKVGPVRVTKGDSPKVKGHDPKDRSEEECVVFAFNIMKKPSLIDPVIEMVESMKENNGKVTFKIKRAKDAIDAIYTKAFLGGLATFTMEEWAMTNQRVIRLQKALETVDMNTMGKFNFTDEKGGDLGKKYMEVINQFVKVGKYLQLGVNSIGNGMRQIYELDGKYHNYINSGNFGNLLGKFVKACVEANIPAKYVAHAVRQVCDSSLNGKIGFPGEKGKENDYLKGNGRFVMFPSGGGMDDKVIKVGYNALGARGNKQEFAVWDKVKNIPAIADQLYKVEAVKGDPDHYVIVCDRATPIDNYKKTEEWCAQMKKLCLKHNIGFIIRCNEGGFGKRNNKVVCVDYGTVHRLDHK